MYGIRFLSGPHQGVSAHHSGQPYLGVGLLVGLGPWIDVTVLEVLAFPTEGAGGGPGLDDEFVGLLEPFPVIGRRGVVGHAFPSRAPDPSGNQPSPGYHVYHRQLFDQPKRVVPDGQDVAKKHDLGPFGDAGQNGGLHVHGPAHAKGRAVVLVQHEPIETHLLGV